MPWWCALAALWLPLCAQAAQRPVTLEDVIRQRRPSALSPLWAPDGQRFVYRQDSKVFLYDTRAQHTKELFDLDATARQATKPNDPPEFQWQNRRVDEGILQWFPDGTALLVLAGGDLFRFDLASGGIVRLTATTVRECEPRLSPNGRFVLFRSESDLYLLEIASGKVRRLTTGGTATRFNGRLDWVYPEELDLGRAAWWSPDSRHIAFLQLDVSGQYQYPHADLLRGLAEPQRYPKAGTPNATVRLGLLTLGDRKPRWLEIGESGDFLLARVDWMPDGSALAVQTLNRVQNRLTLKSISIASGTPRVLLEETDPHWVNLSHDLRFLPGSRQFLWSSERDGFRHLYLYSLDGAPPRRLTHGAWEVSGVACVDATRGQVYYTSTQDSVLDRHLYSVRLEGGQPVRVTQAGGTHTVSMNPSCELYADTYSSLNQPPRTVLHRAPGGHQVAVLREADYQVWEDYRILPTEIVSVAAADGTTLFARLIKPNDFDSRRLYPAIVMVYGGPHAQSVRNIWPGGLTWDQALAHRGYVIWQLDNRGSAGRGHAFETPLHRRLGKTELEDQLAGIRYLVSKGFTDPKRIGIYGWSYGGYMTLYSLLHAPDSFRAGVAGAPVSDWRNYDTIYTERYLGLPSENTAGYHDSSPVHAAANLKAALLLVHNTGDDNVLYQNTVQMMDALEKAGKQYRLLAYPQKSHAVSGSARGHALRAMTEFFEEFLKP